MTLIDNAREVLLKAWSVRLALLSAVFALLDLAGQMLPFLSAYVPDKAFAAATAACGIAAVLARVTKQQNIGGVK